MAQAQSGNFERALKAFESSVNWKSDDPDAWYRLGAVKMQVWDEDGAREAFEAAVEIDSTHQYSLKALQRWRNANP
jgi:Flp pilus assembly protein TadD